MKIEKCKLQNWQLKICNFFSVSSVSSVVNLVFPFCDFLCLFVAIELRWSLFALQGRSAAVIAYLTETAKKRYR